MVKIETISCTIPIWRTFGRNQWHVIPEPHATLQGVKILSAILKIVFRHILFYFCFFFNAVWALTSGGFRIVSDTIVDITAIYYAPASLRGALSTVSVCPFVCLSVA